MATLLIRFRGANFRKLATLAVDQGFGQKVTGSNHLGLICPTCSEMTILSGTQKECTGYKYLNQELRLRNHGLIVPGHRERKCGSVRRNGKQAA